MRYNIELRESRREVNVMGRKNEKAAGQPGEISCKRAREHFYGFAACELSSEDRRDLSHHEASCPACGPEFKEWRSLRSALQGSGKNAAVDFKAGVMARIRETGQQPAPRRSVVWGMVRQHGWARSLAAAAVILIMLTGAVKLPAVEGVIAQLTRQAYIAFNPLPATNPSRNRSHHNRAPPALAALYLQPRQIHLEHLRPITVFRRRCLCSRRRSQRQAATTGFR